MWFGEVEEVNCLSIETCDQMVCAASYPANESRDRDVIIKKLKKKIEKSLPENVKRSDYEISERRAITEEGLVIQIYVSVLYEELK